MPAPGEIPALLRQLELMAAVLSSSLAIEEVPASPTERLGSAIKGFKGVLAAVVAVSAPRIGLTVRMRHAARLATCGYYLCRILDGVGVETAELAAFFSARLETAILRTTEQRIALVR